MVTLIILTAVAICLMGLLIAIMYMRNEEVQVTDKATDLADILPIQTVTQDAIINGNGDIDGRLQDASSRSVHTFGKRSRLHA